MEVYEKIRKETIAIELEQLKVFEVTGKDTTEYLHRMLTQDVRGMASPEVRPACLCTHKGRLLASVLVVHWAESTFLVVSKQQGEALFNQLERYIIMDDVELKDVSEDWTFMSVQGPGAPATFADYCDTALPTWDQNFAATAFSVPQGDGLAFEHTRTGERGWDCMVPSGGKASLTEWLSSRGIQIVSLNDKGVERARIEAGIPSPGQELSDEIIPVEASLGHTISYTKGCYAGQEVIAKIKYLGEPPKTLVNLNSDNPLEGFGGALSVWNGEKQVGRITSWEKAGDDGTAFLALVKTRQIPNLDTVEVRGEGVEGVSAHLSEQALVWGSGFRFQD